MTAKVNLLPQATRESSRQARSRWYVGAILLLTVIALGGVYWWNLTQIREAEERLAEAETVTAGLRAEQAELAGFADLESRLEGASAVLSAALSAEVSLAGLLQDVALVMPGDVQLDTLTFSVGTDDEDETVVGQFTASGQTLTSHAPGVERLLLEFEKAATLDDLFLSTSVLQATEEQPELEGLTTFSFDGRLTATARTGRYDQGLPEGLR